MSLDHSQDKKQKRLNTKREREKTTVSYMIALYCRKNHQTKNGLCASCEELDSYARERTDKCPFMENKTFCTNCKTHCYQEDMGERIRQVMRFSGPRMLFTHPLEALRHLYETKKEKKKLEEI